MIAELAVIDKPFNDSITAMLETAKARRDAEERNKQVIANLEALLNSPDKTAMDAQMRTLTARRLKAEQCIQEIYQKISQAADKGDDYIYYSLDAASSGQEDINDWISTALMSALYGVDIVEALVPRASNVHGNHTFTHSTRTFMFTVYWGTTPPASIGGTVQNETITKKPTLPPNGPYAKRMAQCEEAIEQVKMEIKHKDWHGGGKAQEAELAHLEIYSHILWRVAQAAERGEPGVEVESNYHAYRVPSGVKRLLKSGKIVYETDNFYLLHPLKFRIFLSESAKEACIERQRQRGRNYATALIASLIVVAIGCFWSLKFMDIADGRFVNPWAIVPILGGVFMLFAAVACWCSKGQIDKSFME